MHYLLVNFLLLLMAYFGVAALFQGRRVYARLGAEPFERPPSSRALALYLVDVGGANLAGWIVYPLFVARIKPELPVLTQVLFDHGHEHLGWFALALALAVSGAGLWAGPVLWQAADHRRLARATVRLNGFMLLFIMGSGVALFLLKRLVGN